MTSQTLRFIFDYPHSNGRQGRNRGKVAEANKQKERDL